LVFFGCSSKEPAQAVSTKEKPDLEKYPNGNIHINRLESLDPYHLIAFRTNKEFTYVIYALERKKRYQVTDKFIFNLGKEVEARSKGPLKKARMIIPLSSFKELDAPSRDLKRLVDIAKLTPCEPFFIEMKNLHPMVPQNWPLGKNEELLPPKESQ